MFKGLYQARSKLEFPNRAAGFDPTHPASGTSLRLSAIAQVGGGTASMINLFPFIKGTLTGTPVNTTLASIGPCFAATTAASTNAVSMAVNGASLSTGTFGGIWIHSAVSGSRQILIGNATTTIEFHVLTTGFEWYLNGGSATTTIVLSANVPYFVGATGSSSTGTSMNFVVRNLQTGQLQTQTVAGTLTAGTFATPLVLGNGGGGSNPALANIAALMVSNAYLSMPQMIQWANDPWAFWYPDKTFAVSNTFMSGPPAGATLRGSQQVLWM